MTIQIEIRQNSYFDSVKLMYVSSTLRNIEGVKQAMVAMGTSTNKEIYTELGVVDANLDLVNVNDLIIGIEAQDSTTFDYAFEQMEKLLSNQHTGSSKSAACRTLDEALVETPDANLCVISVPGQHARYEAEKALMKGLHVHLFSDNVSIEDEVALKRLASEKGLLCMGPDCGVSNINGISLLVGSITAKGPIGIIGATGAGIQQIAALIDQAGSGVTQVIGTGGRDLRDEIGGITMLAAFEALENDNDTEVIVIVSRKPGDRCLSKILARIADCRKPVVCNLMGCDSKIIESSGAVSAENLEETAIKALGQIQVPYPMAYDQDETTRIAEAACKKMSEKQKYVRGLFCSGTFCDEAIGVMTPLLGDIHTNIGSGKEVGSSHVNDSRRNIIIDFGEEDFTQGRPHPVLDPETRRRAIIGITEDEGAAVLLMDFILGPAVHPDPVGAVLEDIRIAKQIVSERGGHLSVVASVCGTDKDPQKRSLQEKALIDNEVIVVPSNVQASVLASKIISLRQGDNE